MTRIRVGFYTEGHFISTAQLWHFISIALFGILASREDLGLGFTAAGLTV